jgi:hypothetical protein
VHVRYRVPGYSSNYTGLLDNTDSNAQYTVGEIIPCYYSTHHPDHVLWTVHRVGGGLIFGLVVACLFALPISAGICYVLFRILTVPGNRAYKTFLDFRQSLTKVEENANLTMTETITSQDDCDISSQGASIWRSTSSFISTPVDYFSKTLNYSLSWAKTDNNEAREAYELESQASQASRASSSTTDRSTKRLLSSR